MADNRNISDKVTTSSDRPVPQGMTEAEHRERQRQEQQKLGPQSTVNRAAEQQEAVQQVREQQPHVGQSDIDKKMAEVDKSAGQMQEKGDIAAVLSAEERKKVETAAVIEKQQTDDKNALFEMQKLLEEVTVKARYLNNSDALAALLGAIRTAQHDLM